MPCVTVLKSMIDLFQQDRVWNLFLDFVIIKKKRAKSVRRAPRFFFRWCQSWDPATVNRKMCIKVRFDNIFFGESSTNSFNLFLLIFGPIFLLIDKFHYRLLDYFWVAYLSERAKRLQFKFEGLTNTSVQK